MGNKSETYKVLSRKSDFLRLKESGRRTFPSHWICLNSIENSKGYSRVGWTIPKKVGPAVVRNKLKRWCREFFRQRKYCFEGLELDMNLVFRPREDGFYRKLKYYEFEKAVEKGWKTIRKSTG